MFGGVGERGRGVENTVFPVVEAGGVVVDGTLVVEIGTLIESFYRSMTFSVIWAMSSGGIFWASALSKASVAASSIGLLRRGVSTHVCAWRPYGVCPLYWSPFSGRWSRHLHMIMIAIAPMSKWSSS